LIKTSPIYVKYYHNLGYHIVMLFSICNISVIGVIWRRSITWNILDKWKIHSGNQSIDCLYRR